MQIDPETLMFCVTLGSLCLFKCYQIKNNRTTIKRENTAFKDATSVEEMSHPEILDKVDFDFSKTRAAKSKYKEDISNFKNVLDKNFSPEVLGNFYKNIKTAKVISKVSNSSYGGVYYFGRLPGLKNIIIINNSVLDSFNRNKAPYHELFHLASTNYEDKIYRNGFCYIDYNNGIKLGDGLNEGYTEWLSCKYFSSTEPAYPFETMVAMKLSEILDSDITDKLYLTADLRGLIEELQKYADFEDIRQFITDLDFYTNAETYRTDQRENGNEINKELKERISRIKEFLIKTYNSKNSYSNLSEEEKEDELKKFTNSLEIVIPLVNNEVLFGDYRAYEDFLEKTSSVRI